MKLYCFDKKAIKAWKLFEKRTGLGNYPSKKDEKIVLRILKRLYGKTCMPTNIKVHDDHLEVTVMIDDETNTNL